MAASAEDAGLQEEMEDDDEDDEEGNIYDIDDSLANDIIGLRHSASTKKTYQGKINKLKEYLRVTFPSTIDEEGEIILPLIHPKVCGYVLWSDLVS
jgi:hypothetical protein